MTENRRRQPGYDTDEACTCGPGYLALAAAHHRKTCPVRGLAESRAVVAKVQADMKHEADNEALRVIASFDTMSPIARMRWTRHAIERQRQDAAALDYAETRLSEMRAQLEALANEFCKPFGPDASKWPAGFAAPYAAAGEAIREVARG